MVLTSQDQLWLYSSLAAGCWFLYQLLQLSLDVYCLHTALYWENAFHCSNVQRCHGFPIRLLCLTLQQLMRERQQMASRPFASVAVALDATAERMDLMQPVFDVSPAVTHTHTNNPLSVDQAQYDYFLEPPLRYWSSNVCRAFVFDFLLKLPQIIAPEYWILIQ